MPDSATRCEANVRRRRQLAVGVPSEGADDGRHYEVTPDGRRFLSARRPR
jgi:hypothetical protein